MYMDALRDELPVYKKQDGNFTLDGSETRKDLTMMDKEFDRYRTPLYYCNYIVVFGLVITVACFVVQYIVSTAT